VGVCGKRQIRCETTRRCEPAWDSWAVECRTRVHAQGMVKGSSEPKGYALPEGQQKRMPFDGVRVVARIRKSRRIKR
jgi:hypothetical protein